MIRWCGRKHAELYRADDREIVQSGIAKHHYEEPFINKEGEEVIWLTSKLPLKNTDGETFGLVAISENITAERLASKKLKESEERFRGIFEHANIGIAIADEKGTILDVNKGYLEITGYSYNEFVGLNYTTITQPDDLAKEKIFNSGSV